MVVAELSDKEGAVWGHPLTPALTSGKVFFEAQEEDGTLGVACRFQQVVSAESGRKMS